MSKPLFEDKLASLHDIANRLEKGDLSLETALAQFEKGMKLANDCHRALTEAEQKVALITEESGELFESDFALDEEDDEEDDA